MLDRTDANLKLLHPHSCCFACRSSCGGSPRRGRDRGANPSVPPGPQAASRRHPLALGPRRAPGGFTLIELLVVMSIIALLISLLMPALRGARTAAQRAACLSNHRQIGIGMYGYTVDYEDWLPFYRNGAWAANSCYPKLVAPYVSNWSGTGAHVNGPKIDILTCPADEKPYEQAGWWGRTSYGWNISFGYNHPNAAYNVGGWYKPARRITQAAEPSRSVAQVDWKAPTGNTPPYFDHFYIVSTNPELGIAFERHGDATNILLLDGHAASEGYLGSDYETRLDLERPLNPSGKYNIAKWR